VSDGFLAPRLCGQFADRQHRFDQESLAHCPVFHSLNMFGVERRVPAFWLYRLLLIRLLAFRTRLSIFGHVLFVLDMSTVLDGRA
jgi:hypothetical protein